MNIRMHGDWNYFFKRSLLLNLNLYWNTTLAFQGLKLNDLLKLPARNSGFSFPSKYSENKFPSFFWNVPKFDWNNIENVFSDYLLGNCILNFLMPNAINHSNAILVFQSYSNKDSNSAKKIIEKN